MSRFSDSLGDMLGRFRNGRIPGTESLAPNIPNTESVADLPKDERRSAKKVASYIQETFDHGLSIRRRHARIWLYVRAIMKGIHHFSVSPAGLYRPLSEKKGKVRAVYPIMEPGYRWELGRLNANQIGVSATPTTGRGYDGYFRADRAESILRDWLREIDADGTIKEETNQQLCYWGGSWLFRDIDPFRRQVTLDAIPQTEIFPIPYSAKTIRECDGIMRVQIVSKEWLELQDDLWTRSNPGKSRKPWASYSGSYSGSMTESTIGLGAFLEGSSGNQSGARAITAWMKPNEQNPGGQVMFFLEDEMAAYRGSADPSSPSLFNGKIPLEPIYYTKKPDDFWGSGYCETQIAPQLEANRQLAIIVQNAKRNRAILGYNTSAIAPDDIQDEESGLIPIRPEGYSESRHPPLLYYPPQSSGPDVGAVLQIAFEMSRRAGGMESSIIFGQQEGRTDSGPATAMLNTNASTPLQPVVDRIYRAWERTLPEVLDMLRSVWPEEKTIRVVGQQNIGRELRISREQVPWSNDVLLVPFPMAAGGRNSMLSLLMSLRQLPADDGKGFEIKSRELRRSLRMMGMTPPGIEIGDPQEERINYRIGMLINDGMTPAIQGAWAFPEQVMENHGLAIELLREKILAPDFLFYGPMVKKALLDEAEWHRSRLQGVVPPNRFDDALDEMEGLRAEAALDAEEQDVTSPSGHLTLNGQVLGM